MHEDYVSSSEILILAIEVDLLEVNGDFKLSAR
jgi:hypothetical protein